jgi:galactose mutarotase-like enzyme
VTLPVESVRIARAGAEAWLAPARGGLLTRLSLRGEDVLFLDEGTLADPAKNVRGGVPVLFPIAGKLSSDTLAGATAPLKQHGFARNLPWSVVEGAADRVTLGLDADETTRAAFPHDFALRYTYSVSEASLNIVQVIHNRGPDEMRVQPGLHPYFLVGDKARVRVESDATRAWDNVAGEERPFRAGALDLASGEIDLHLLDHRPPGTRLVRPGARDLVLGWSADQTVLVLWTLPGRPFVCVEPWSAPAGALHRGGGLRVAPGGAHTSTFTIAIA